MANFFKEEIDQFGVRCENAVVLAGQQLNETVRQISTELHDQRKLTKDDVQGLVDYAALKFGEALDLRIEKLRNETSQLVTQKITQVRAELGEAANEQKRVAVWNATVAVSASILVGLVSLFYRKYLHGDIDLMDVFRSTMLAMAVGYTLWLIFKRVGGYLQSSRFKRNAIIAGLGYLDVFRPKGTYGQVFILIVMVGIWVAATFSSSLLAFIGK